MGELERKARQRKEKEERERNAFKNIINFQIT
jgi:hypothetical protein